VRGKMRRGGGKREGRDGCSFNSRVNPRRRARYVRFPRGNWKRREERRQCLCPPGIRYRRPCRKNIPSSPDLRRKSRWQARVSRLVLACSRRCDAMLTRVSVSNVEMKKKKNKASHAINARLNARWKILHRNHTERKILLKYLKI